MSKETLIEQLRGYKSTPRHCEELCYEAANEIESMIQKLIVAHEESEFDHSEYKRLREDLRQQLADRLEERDQYRNDAYDFHGQVNRLTEWNNNLASHIYELKSELFDLTKQRDALSRMADTLEQERDQLREQVTDLHGQVGLLLRTAKALAATEPKV